RLSAFSRTAHVLSTTTSAAAASVVGANPSCSSRPAIRSESCSFIWHPKVRIRYRPAIGIESSSAAFARARGGSPGELDGPGLPDHGDPDLSRVLELLLDLLGDV